MRYTLPLFIKKQALVTFTLLLSFSVVSTNSVAQWYESTGSAVIINNDEKTAKNQAVQNALKKALLVAGASVSSVQQVVNGLLTQNEMSIRASGNVNSLELISETYADKMATVKIRANIFEDQKQKQCPSASLKKNLLLTRSHIRHREQANLGSLYPLETELIKKLAEKINQQDANFTTTLAIQAKTEFNRLNHGFNTEHIKTLTTALASMTDTQYVLFSEIDDLSIYTIEGSTWKFWQGDSVQRQFNSSFYIYDGITGEKVFSKQYKAMAPWQFKPREKIDISSQHFWQSAYGEQINQNLDRLVSDFIDEMICQPSQGKIFSVAGNKVMFNLGKRHGVNVGDEFTLLHLEQFISDEKRSYKSINISPHKVVVTQVSQDTAQAITTERQLLDNIQVNDLVAR